MLECGFSRVSITFTADGYHTQNISSLNNCNETHAAVQLTSLLELGVFYTCMTFHFRNTRWDSPYSSSFDMMLICICSEKCYDVLKILYFGSGYFIIIQRHVDTLAFEVRARLPS